MIIRSRSTKAGNLIALSAVIVILFSLLILFNSFREYDYAIIEGEKNARKLVAITADYMDLTFDNIKLILEKAADRQYFNLLFGGKIASNVVENFNLWVDESPYIAAMMLVDEKGEVEFAAHNKDYQGWVDYRDNFTDTKAFDELKRNPDISFFVGTYFARYANYKDVIITAKRIDKLNGEFGGIIVAAIKSQYFLDFFNSINHNKSKNILLTLGNGQDVFAGIKDKLNIEQENSFLSKVEWKKNSTSFLQNKNGMDLIISSTSLKNAALTLLIMVDENNFLNFFWKNRKKDGLFLAIFIIFATILSTLAIAMANQIKKVEESEETAILASQAKSEFLANMSHELRTPLNAIIGFSEMLNSGYFGKVEPKQKERLGDINLCGNHLLQLITDILEFSKGEAGKLELVEEDVDLKEIISETIRMMNEKAIIKKINIGINIDEFLPHIFADKRKIRQILINLLNNSIKFTPENGVINISARKDFIDSISIEVNDSGIGIGENDISKALSIFGQVHRNHSHEGTGLGLPLCRMFTELHGGKLLLNSKLGVGTSVTIVIPPQRVIRNSRSGYRARSSDMTFNEI